MRPPLSAVDFSRSSCGWLLPEQQSYGSFALDAVLTAHSPQGEEAFALSAQIAAGHVYGNGALFRDPPYGYSIALGASEYRIFRDAWRGKSAEDTEGSIADRFRSVGVLLQSRDAIAVPPEDLFPMAGTRFPPLSARVHIPPQPGLQALTLEFPVRHINVNPQTRRFQVETGPVLLALPGPGAIVGRLRRAWAMFGRSDRIEFMFDSSRPAGERSWSGHLVQGCAITLMR